MYYQFAYAKKLNTFKASLDGVKDCAEVTQRTGELEQYKWYDPHGFVVAWEWRPRIWWR